ncbi:hypothetical protein [Streptomyces sp. NBC_01794]|uniref:hypothetical protein n=1 Tax=Streptomyces sp. NBC_01794 TaxID=2975942 RepID=UPI0030862E28|nr:hypothetical protein OIE54_15945 [Streptomyces sp. NBC_01794]
MAEPSCLRATRPFYDAVAVDYTERYRTGLEAEPDARMLREPDRDEKVQQAHLMARKPGKP